MCAEKMCCIADTPSALQRVNQQQKMFHVFLSFFIGASCLSSWECTLCNARHCLAGKIILFKKCNRLKKKKKKTLWLCLKLTQSVSKHNPVKHILMQLRVGCWWNRVSTVNSQFDVWCRLVPHHFYRAWFSIRPSRTASRPRKTQSICRKCYLKAEIKWINNSNKKLLLLKIGLI